MIARLGSKIRWAVLFCVLPAVLPAAILSAAMAGDASLRTVAPPTHAGKLESQSLPNLIRVTEHIYCGGLPSGHQAFDELVERGIRTVISVDGVMPDVERARAAGLRYVHLPHGYDGIGESRIRELAYAFLTLDGPIYVHCHHGKHRSPAAAGVGAVAAGLISSRQARTLLEVAGTSPSYRGLIRTVTSATPLNRDELLKAPIQFLETSPIPPLVEAMVEIQHHFERLAVRDSARPSSESRSSNAESAHDALLLEELYRELLRSDVSRDRPEGFRLMLESSLGNVRRMKKSLESQSQLDSFNDLIGVVGEDCKSCHQRFRD